MTMVLPEIPAKETERLLALLSYSILDTMPERDYDDLVTIASEVCNTPIASITLVDRDRQWFKAKKGIGKPETSRDESFCAHAINYPLEIFTVENASEDPRFCGNPSVLGDPKIAFYAGVPLINEDGLAMGTICVVDSTPKKLTETQQNTLRALGRQVMNLMELRKKKIDLEKSMELLYQKNQHLEKFALIAAHDIKSPLSAIAGMTGYLSTRFQEDFSSDTQEILKLIDQSSNRIVNLVDGILTYSRNANILEQNSLLQVRDLFEDLKYLFPTLDQDHLGFRSDVQEITVNHIGLKQILLNLITNAIKYNDKSDIRIEVSLTEDDQYYHFGIADNGMGIPEDYHDKIFEMFTKAHSQDRFGQSGSGIGLATVKNLVTKLGGDISVESVPGKGTTFRFTILR